MIHAGATLLGHQKIGRGWMSEIGRETSSVMHRYSQHLHGNPYRVVSLHSNVQPSPIGALFSEIPRLISSTHFFARSNSKEVSSIAE